MSKIAMCQCVIADFSIAVAAMFRKRMSMLHRQRQNKRIKDYAHNSKMLECTALQLRMVALCLPYSKDEKDNFVIFSKNTRWCGGGPRFPLRICQLINKYSAYFHIIYS